MTSSHEVDIAFTKPMSLGPASCVKILLGESMLHKLLTFKIHTTFLEFFRNPFLVQVHVIFGFRLTFVLCIYGKEKNY